MILSKKGISGPSGKSFPGMINSTKMITDHITGGQMECRNFLLIRISLRPVQERRKHQRLAGFPHLRHCLALL